MRKYIFLALSLITAFTLSMSAQAQEVTFTTHLARYDGSGAYLAIYLADAHGRYRKTIWVAGRNARYYFELPGWARGSRLRPSEYDGMTGASVTSGHTLVVTKNIPDNLINKGYQIVIDSAVENGNSNRADISTPLTTAGSGKTVMGSVYVLSFRYDLK